MTSEGVRAEQLIADVIRLSGTRCPCTAPLCGHTLLTSVLLGQKSRPRCLDCIARGLGREPHDLAAHVAAAVQRQDCYRTAWRWTSEREGSCPLGAVAAADLTSATPLDELVDADEEFDAGDMSCGDLVLELRIRLQAHRVGTLLRVIAQDPGARADLPAWCGLTGNRLVAAQHPVYVIRKEDR